MEKNGIPKKNGSKHEYNKVLQINNVLLGKGNKKRDWHSGKEVPNTDYVNGVVARAALFWNIALSSSKYVNEINSNKRTIRAGWVGLRVSIRYFYYISNYLSGSQTQSNPSVEGNEIIVLVMRMTNSFILNIKNHNTFYGYR